MLKRPALILLIALFVLSVTYAALAQSAPLGGTLPAATLIPPTATLTPSPVPTQVPLQVQSQSKAGAQSVSVPNADATCHYDATHGVYLVLMCEVWPAGQQSMYVPWKPGCTAPRYSQCR